MPTFKQEKVAELRTLHPDWSKIKVLRMAGYGASIKSWSGRTYNSKGVREALAKWGLVEGLVAKSLVADIKQKPRRRYNELNLAADILGMKKYATLPPSNIFIITPEQRRVIARRIVNGGSTGEGAHSGLRDRDESEVLPQLAS